MIRYMMLFLLAGIFPILAFSQQPTSGEIEIEYLFTVGETIGFGEEGYLISPFSLVTDQNGRIYVSEHEERQIHQYTANGEYIRSFGGPGRGPGEFNEISEIAIDSENRLLAMDRFQFKVSRFNTESGDIEEHMFEDMSQINMSTLITLPDDRFAGVYVESGPRLTDPEKIRAVRMYRFGEGEKESSVFEIFRHQFNPDDTMEARLGTGLGHHLSKLSEKEMVAGHNVYMGRHFMINRDTGDVRVFENSELSPPHTHEMDPDDRPQDFGQMYAGSVSGGDQSGTFYYQILHYSMVYALLDENLLHIYRQNEKEGFAHSTMLEIFSPDGDLLFHDEIEIEQQADEEPEFRQYLHIDEQGRLFVLDRYEMDDPKIRVYQIGMK